MDAPGNVTELLINWRQGDEEALNKLIAIVYDELRRIAANRLHHEGQQVSLQATVLVNEAYLRLINCEHYDWQNRAHFFGVAAQVMRNILVDHARRRLAAKREGGKYRLSLEDIHDLSDKKDIDLIALDDALASLRSFDELKSTIIELRYFAGLTLEETAEYLKLPVIKIRREWDIAKMWLLREIERTA